MEIIENKATESIKEEDFKSIIDSARIIWETPPKDEKLDDKLVEKDRLL